MTSWGRTWCGRLRRSLTRCADAHPLVRHSEETKENEATALPENSASEPHLFTVAEYAELGEPESGYSELQEGRILMSPSPSPNHSHASLRLAMQFVDQLPTDLEIIQDVDVDLELVPYGDPGFSRRPDLVVIPRSARDRVSDEGEC